MRTLRELFRHLPEDGDIRNELRQFNLWPTKGGKPASVRELAERLGFIVQRKRLPKGMAGRLVQDPFAENGYCIEVNERHSVESQRWTVLHEMGHYFLHANHRDPLADPTFLDRSASAFYTNTNEEREANQFAAVLLFGDGALEGARGSSGNDKERLAKLFGVSVKTIEIALKQF